MRTLADRIAERIGIQHTLTLDADKAPYLVEWRDRYHGKALVVAKPGTTAEVAALMRLAHETRTPVVAQGGNTGLVGGQIADESGTAMVLSLTRLNRVRDLDPTSDTLTIEAGATLKAAQLAAEGIDRLFPLSLASEGSCTIGGTIATNAGGVAVIAYGMMRDLVLGLEVVLADGRIWNGLRKLKKDNTGYHLADLFIGSEGTLGIVTAATLKLFPRPAAVATAFIAIPDPAAALAILHAARRGVPGTITAIELLPRIGIEFVLRHASARDPFVVPSPWYVLLEVSSSQAGALEDALGAVLEGALERGEASDAVLAASLDQAAALWHLREALSDVQRFEGGSIKHDVSVPVAAVPAFLEEAIAVVKEMVPGGRPVPFGHVGDGNIHFNISQPVDGDKAAFLAQMDAVNARVHAIVTAHGGSISAEHGIGQAKRDLLPGVKSEVELDLMRAVKQALDPVGILNPGKVIPERS